jgi:hypothetical protein
MDTLKDLSAITPSIYSKAAIRSHARDNQAFPAGTGSPHTIFYSTGLLFYHFQAFCRIFPDNLTIELAFDLC